jgi:integrase
MTRKDTKVQTSLSDHKQQKRGKRVQLSREKVREILRMAELTNNRDFLLMRLLLVTGMRVSECASIRIEDIDFKNRSLTIPNLKHFGTRVVYFDKLTSERLLNYIKQNNITERLFHITTRPVENIIKKYGRIADCSIVPHTFRHTFATYADEQGMRFWAIQKLLGHDINYRQTDIYIHSNPTDLKAEYDKLFFESY